MPHFLLYEKDKKFLSLVWVKEKIIVKSIGKGETLYMQWYSQGANNEEQSIKHDVCLCCVHRLVMVLLWSNEDIKNRRSDRAW